MNMCTTNAVTNHVSAVKTTGRNVGAGSGFTKAHCECSDLSVCTASAVTLHAPRCKSSGDKPWALSSDLTKAYCESSDFVDTWESVTNVTTNHKTIVKTMVKVWSLLGECSDLHAHCLSSDLNMVTARAADRTLFGQ